jgi:ubiquinone/menaquinone biosynthesis C-methylase UbiE
LLDFSGERVVPGLVDENLFNEHVARYHFAARFLPAHLLKVQPVPVQAARVLDAGCGSGYGTALFGPQASAIGIDIAHDAVRHARETYSGPGVTFAEASCTAIPFADACFDLVTAFEVIEHIERWPDLLREAARVTKPTGVFLVSTPNKTYYGESRAEAGPNPYHVHEFEYEEFALALAEAFPHVHLWSQNHAEAIAFASPGAVAGSLAAERDHSPESAHFYFAACSHSPIPHIEAFAWLPAGGNVLRERERHISLLESEVRQKTAWLEEQTRKHGELQKEHTALLGELRQRNEWAAKLNGDVSNARAVIEELQKETAVRLNWVRDLEGQIANGNGEIERRVAELEKTRKDFEDARAWGKARAEEARQALELIEKLKARRMALEATRWVRLGRQLGLLPDHTET